MLAALYNKIRAALEAEHDRYILWVPALMAAGVAWYFHLDDEPPLWLGGSILILCLFLAMLLRQRTFWRYLCIAAGLVALGITLAQWRAHSIHSPHLNEPIAFAYVSGKVVEIAPTPKGSKLLLEDVTIEKLPAEKTPRRISITLRSYDASLMTGQRVSLKAGLFPPPAPAIAGGFDFGRYFYFREIGAVGFSMGHIEATPLENSGAGNFEIWFSEFRHRLTESIRSYFHEPAGAVAAAFVTGETRAIPESINDDMRISGLYHLLAVSGMNLSVVAGLAFFSLRFLFASIPALALRYPIKKWAALLALIASYVYLRISGTPVSAERAFFMVSLIFIAILLDRDPTPMRSVAIAAFCLILYEPESVLTASFQLSFSATAALIASYEWGIQWFSRQSKTRGFGIHRIAFYFGAVIATSFVAWLGTDFFIIYHFNQFSSYSLLANTVADPLVSFILMPLVIAGLLLMPLGLAWMAFTPMQYGVDWLLKLADWTAHLPHAMWVVPAPTDAGFAVVAFGILWIYFWRASWRWLGAIAVMLGMSTAFFYVPPDVFINPDGTRVAVRLDDGRVAMVCGRKDSVVGEQWARAATEHELVGKNETDMKCDREGCIVHARGHTIAVLKDTNALADDCRMADIVILSKAAPHEMPCGLLIDKTLLDKGGAVTLRFKDGKTDMQQVRSGGGRRPWTQVSDTSSE